MKANDDNSREINNSVSRIIKVINNHEKLMGINRNERFTVQIYCWRSSVNQMVV